MSRMKREGRKQQKKSFPTRDDTATQSDRGTSSRRNKTSSHFFPKDKVKQIRQSVVQVEKAFHQLGAGKNRNSKQKRETAGGSQLVDNFKDWCSIQTEILDTITTPISGRPIRLFLSFQPSNISYGGGNSFCLSIVNFLFPRDNVTVTYALEGDIDIFLIIDPYKGPYKRYGLDDVVSYKETQLTRGRHRSYIIVRVNDCDITRPGGVRERKIIERYKQIDYLVFNSHFIQSYYLREHPVLQHVNREVIYNGGNPDIFYPLAPKKKGSPVRVVTHHWSSNLYKGYDVYYRLWKYFQDMEYTSRTWWELLHLKEVSNQPPFKFVFIGKNVPDTFREVPIKGPYHGHELADQLRSCDIYITASRYDSCPNHVIEALLCGLPILYTSSEGGGRDLCELSPCQIGEDFNNFADLMAKLNKINQNYQYYRNNVLGNLSIHRASHMGRKYYELFRTISSLLG